MTWKCSLVERGLNIENIFESFKKQIFSAENKNFDFIYHTFFRQNLQSTKSFYFIIIHKYFKITENILTT